MKGTIYMCILFFALAGCKKAEIERVKLAELNGDEIDLRDFKGKTVFLNYWATWCGPCVKEMPTIEFAQTSLKDKGVVFLIASNEEPEEIKEFNEQRAYNFHYVRVLNMEEIEIPALPTTQIYDQDGNLRFSESGSRDWSEPDNLKLILSGLTK